MGPLLGQNGGQARGPQRPWPGPGLRLAGAYSSGPLRFEFHEESVIVGCGQTMDARAYTVQQSGPQLVIQVQNEGQPITLAMQPNGVLNGSGPVQITGHSFVGNAGSSATNYTQASSARCMLGTLTPGN